jgi:hypothetical protein
VSDTLGVSLIVACAGILGPLALEWVKGRGKVAAMATAAALHKAEKDEDYRRQDAVAKAAAKTAALLLEQQAATIAATVAVKEQAAEAAQLLAQNTKAVTATAQAQDAKLDRQEGKIDRIHVLVNSTLTAAKQGELNSLRANMVLMQKVVTLESANGQSASPEAAKEMEVTAARISELEGELVERDRSTVIAHEITLKDS